MTDQEIKALRAELDALKAANADLSKRAAARTEPKKENYAFVPNGVLGERQIEIPYAAASMKFLPSKAGKRNVFTLGVQFPGGIKGQLVLTRPLA